MVGPPELQLVVVGRVVRDEVEDVVRAVLEGQLKSHRVV